MPTIPTVRLFVCRMAWTARVLGPARLWMVWYIASVLVSNLAVKRAMELAPDRMPLAS